MRKILFTIAIVGLLVSGYLSIVYATQGPIPCSLHGGCEVVRASTYAHIFGISTPYYGVVYYVLLALGALLLTPLRKAALRIPLLVLTGMGLAVSIWLTYLEAFVIQAWCQWCLVSAVLTLLAFLVVWGTLSKRS